MAYQRHERTVTVIDSYFLVPNPFDADTSSPIVIVNGALGSLSGTALADLHSQLPLATPSNGTVVLQTRGLDQALGDPAAFGRRADQAARRSERHKERWIDGDSGLWVLTAPPPVLRAWGVELSGPDGAGVGEGEVQVLRASTTKSHDRSRLSIDGFRRREKPAEFADPIADDGVHARFDHPGHVTGLVNGPGRDLQAEVVHDGHA
jgi:hypothetical protein